MKPRIDNCPEGGEGIVINILQLIPINWARCTNFNCPINSKCVRFQQHLMDLKDPSIMKHVVSCEFFNPIREEPDHDYEKDNFCGKFIKVK